MKNNTTHPKVLKATREQPRTVNQACNPPSGGGPGSIDEVSETTDSFSNPGLKMGNLNDGTESDSVETNVSAKVE
jgi:hypothetical protein